jgi:hypothetical protein
MHWDGKKNIALQTQNLEQLNRGHLVSSLKENVYYDAKYFYPSVFFLKAISIQVLICHLVILISWYR